MSVSVFEYVKDTQFAGAFVKEPKVGFYAGVSAFDFASLYPSIMRQFNISPDSYIEKVTAAKIEERRKDKIYLQFSLNEGWWN